MALGPGDVYIAGKAPEDRGTRRVPDPYGERAGTQVERLWEFTVGLG